VYAVAQPCRAAAASALNALSLVALGTAAAVAALGASGVLSPTGAASAAAAMALVITGLSVCRTAQQLQQLYFEQVVVGGSRSVLGLLSGALLSSLLGWSDGSNPLSASNSGGDARHSRGRAQRAEECALRRLIALICSERLKLNLMPSQRASN
jgi:hypothetical protein